MNKLIATMGVLVVNTICTLKCKNCITFTPYHINPQHYEVEHLCHEIDKFFEIYDEVEHFDLEGGETLLHPNLPTVIEKVLTYKSRFKTLNILTNGTLIPNEAVLKSCEGQPVLFIIDDYGRLSVNKESVIRKLKDYQIEHRVDVYHGEDQYYGGWIDFGNLQYKEYSEEQLRAVFKKCRSGSCGAPYIKNGKIFLCPIQAIEVDHIELMEGEYIDLLSDTQTAENWIEVAKHFSEKPINSCNFCKGFDVSSVRLNAAEQIEGNSNGGHDKFVKN